MKRIGMLVVAGMLVMGPVAAHHANVQVNTEFFSRTENGVLHTTYQVLNNGPKADIRCKVVALNRAGRVIGTKRVTTSLRRNETKIERVSVAFSGRFFDHAVRHCHRL